MNEYRIIVMKRTFNTFEEAEAFAERVEGTVLYDKDTGSIIVAW